MNDLAPNHVFVCIVCNKPKRNKNMVSNSGICKHCYKKKGGKIL